MNGKSTPSAEEVITKLKDDGYFDSLRLMIVRKVKENEDLRNSIITEVKQSVILNADGSEDLKPRQLSDAIYQELGSKIMGQISDEVWKVIRSGENKDEIKSTVESVFQGLLNPKSKEDKIHSPPPKDQLINGKEDNAPTVIAPADGFEPNEPPGFVQCDEQASNNGKMECKEPIVEQHLFLPAEEVFHQPLDVSDPSDAMPPGFGPGGHGAELQGDASDEDPDVPPGFG